MGGYALLFLTGLSGLGGESLYLKLFDIAVGSSPAVAFAVVAVYILGAGLGAWLGVALRRPFWLELAQLAYVAAWLGALEPLLGLNAQALRLLQGPLGPTAAPALLAVLYLLLPAIGSGLCFPLLAELVRRPRAAYATHALGALCGILLIEALAFPRWGLAGGLVILLVAHLLCAAGLWPLRFAATPLARVRPLPSLVAIGVVTGSFQSLWLFFANLLFRQRYFVGSVVIGAMVLGLCIGSALWARNPRSLRETLRLVFFGMLGSLGLVTLAVWTLPLQYLPVWAIVLTAFALILPAAVPIGGIFAAAVRAACAKETVASVNLSLALGNVGGLLGFHALGALLPAAWGFVPLLLALAALELREPSEDGGHRLPSAGRTRARLALGVGLAIACCLLLSDAKLISLSRPGARDVAIERVFRGFGEVSAIYRLPEPWNERWFYQTGRSPVELQGDPEPLAGAVSAAYSPRHEKALVLGIGTGLKAGAVASSFRHTDAIDISASTAEVIRHLAAENLGLASNPRVRFHQFDAIMAPEFLEGGYDLIVLTISPAFLFSSAKVFTQEYYRKLKKLLSPDGVFVTWGNHGRSLEGNQILLNTARALYRNEKLYRLGGPARPEELYYLAVYSDGPILYQPGLLPPLTPALDLTLRRPEEGQLLGRLQLHDTQRLNSLFSPSVTILLDTW